MPRTKIRVHIVETTTYDGEHDAQTIFEAYFKHLTRQEFDMLSDADVLDGIEHSYVGPEDVIDFERHGDVSGQVWTLTSID